MGMNVQVGDAGFLWEKIFSVIEEKEVVMAQHSCVKYVLVTLIMSHLIMTID
jgi:hypothetical protein